MTTYEIAQEIAHEVEATGYGTARLVEDDEGWHLTLTTGGWSEAEEIIDRLHCLPEKGLRPAESTAVARWLWRTLTWQTIERGGRFTFADSTRTREIAWRA